MRLFIALNLIKKERQRIIRAARPLRDVGLPVRWVEEDNLHLTLKFLGEIRPERVPGLEQAMATVAEGTAPFSMTLGGFGAFPTIRRPRVLWLGAEASPALRCLKQDLEWGLTDCGFEAETRAFHPHLTLGRSNPADGAGAFRGLDSLVADMAFSTEIPVRTIDLMRSVRSKEGQRYTRLSSAKLTGT
ncbi:MAG TPA: RNA 2',3'-cyclic phosphodiesterase [Longimicrobiales bacterium]|nr:RNA 2',3'-cyclic phosphodiesterase [Longimicrobiales bacterium]